MHQKADAGLMFLLCLIFVAPFSLLAFLFAFIAHLACQGCGAESGVLRLSTRAPRPLRYGGARHHPSGGAVKGSGMSESSSGASPSTKKSGNYKIPLILAPWLLLTISPFFYSAYVDATVGRGGPDDVSSGWAFVWALYHLTPPGLILLGLAFIIGFAQTLSYISSSNN